MAIGYNACAVNIYTDADRASIAIGKNSIANGRETLAVGEGAHAKWSASIAIGNYAGGAGGAQANGIAIGVNTISDGGITIGAQAVSRGAYPVTLGHYACVWGNCAVGIGFYAGTDNCYREYTTAVGALACTPIIYATAIGAKTMATAEKATVLGYGSTGSHAGATVLGPEMESVVTNHAHVNNLFIFNTPEYADNTAALAAGLTGGQVYKTSTGTLMITY